jgi:hypothetical protein
LFACSEGQLWRGEERELLRTALVRQDTADGMHHAALLLSNGLFECDLPTFDDPARVEQTLQAVITAACREGARHLNLQLWRDAGSDWTGDFSGIASAGPHALGTSSHRVAGATWFAVNEAYLAESIDANRVLAALEDELVLDAAAGGTVRIHKDNGELVGDAWIPELGVHVTFKAQYCDPSASLFALLEASPAFVCP